MATYNLDKMTEGIEAARELCDADKPCKIFGDACDCADYQLLNQKAHDTAAKWLKKEKVLDKAAKALGIPAPCEHTYSETEVFSWVVGYLWRIVALALIVVWIASLLLGLPMPAHHGTAMVARKLKNLVAAKRSAADRSDRDMAAALDFQRREG